MAHRVSSVTTSRISFFAPLLLLQLASPGLGAPPKAGDLTTEPYVITDRAGKKIAGEFGRVRVPENRTRPGSRLIEVAFVRFKSPLENPGPPVFFLAGGPGGSGIESVKRAVQGNAKVILSYFGGDIIGIDQRGTGLAKPNLRTPGWYGIPLAEPGNPNKMLPRMQKVCARAADYWKKKGVDLTGYNTAENADDINAVRKALGYKKINLWGGSYGSHLAFAVIRRHDRHLHRVAVQSPEGPNHTWKLPSQIQEGLERIAKLVAVDPQLKEKMPDMVGTLKTVLNRLEKRPVVVEVKHPLSGAKVKVGISKFDVQMMIANAIGRVRTMRPVPKAIYDMSQGDFTFVAKQLVSFRSFAGPRSAMSMMMDSASGATADRLKQIKREAKTHLLGDAVNFPYPEICSAWGSPDLGDEFRGPLRSKVAILIVCGDLDSRTPIRNAKELLQHLPNGKLIEVENGAHDFSLFQSSKLRSAVQNFYRGKPVEVKRVRLPQPEFDPIDD